eukprot:GHVS01008198.1.p1 GENE.GHVS01008198.1~~GHVS01008198.1.p1  ORF type:complete len:354 (-),score=103.48 GHVS01008198.1:470-1531(-)
MGKSKSAREVNPTDKYRKQLREKEKKRNKNERKRLREEAALRRDPEGVRDELTRLEQQRDRGQLEAKGYKRLNQLELSWQQIKQKALAERNSVLWSDQAKEQKEEEQRNRSKQDEDDDDDDNSDDDSDEESPTTTTPSAVPSSIHLAAVKKVIASFESPLPPAPPPLPVAPPFSSSCLPPLPPTLPPPTLAPPTLPAASAFKPPPAAFSPPPAPFHCPPSAASAYHALGLATLAALRPPPPPAAPAVPPMAASFSPPLPPPSVEQPAAKPPPAQLFVPTQLRVQHKASASSPAASSSSVKFAQKQMSSVKTVTAFSVSRSGKTASSASQAKPPLGRDMDQAFENFLKEVGDTT